MAYLTNTAAVQNPGHGAIAATVERIATAWKRHRMYRETFEGLDALSDRELADLGLTRGELRFVAKRAAREATLR